MDEEVHVDIDGEFVPVVIDGGKRSFDGVLEGENDGIDGRDTVFVHVIGGECGGDIAGNSGNWGIGIDDGWLIGCIRW